MNFPKKQPASTRTIAPPVSWEEIRFFMAAARKGSLNAASTDAGVDPTTLSRRISALEDRLGVRLLDRGPTGLKLTEDGKGAFQEAELMEAAAQRFVRGTAGNDVRLAGTVRLSVTEGLASHWVVPRLPSLTQKYPDIDVVIESTNFIGEISSDVDIAIRYSPPTNGDLIGRRGPTMYFRLFGTKAYTDLHGMPASIKDLCQHSFIDHTIQHHVPSLGPWLAMLATLPVSLRVASYINVLAGMNSGIGLSLQPVYATAMAPHLITADLDLGFKSDTWIIYRSEQRSVARVRAIADEILSMGRRDQGDFFGGPPPL